MSCYLERVEGMYDKFLETDPRFTRLEYAECTMGKDGVLGKWKVDTPEFFRPRLVSTGFVNQLALRDLFHPTQMDFVFKDAPLATSFINLNTELVTQINLHFEVTLKLEKFYVDWLVVDNWCRLIHILLVAFPWMERITWRIFIVPHPRYTNGSPDWLRSFADIVFYLTTLLEQRILRPLQLGANLEWLEVEMFCRGICDSEFVKLGSMRYNHPLFTRTNGPGWNRQERVVFDEIGREHWLTVGILDPSGEKRVISDPEVPSDPEEEEEEHANE